MIQRLIIAILVLTLGLIYGVALGVSPEDARAGDWAGGTPDSASEGVVTVTVKLEPSQAAAPAAAGVGQPPTPAQDATK